MTGSNRRPSACKADALPAELITLRAELSLNNAAHYKQPNVRYATIYRYFFYKYQKHALISAAINTTKTGRKSPTLLICCPSIKGWNASCGLKT